EFFPPSALLYPTAVSASLRMLSPLAPANLPAHSRDQMPHAQRRLKIAPAEMLNNSAYPIYTGRQRARWQATASSGNQTAPDDRAAHIWSRRSGNKRSLPVTRVTRDDYRATPPKVL